jgi:cobalt transporter subunit CbtA
MKLFQRIFFAAVLAGLAAGSLMSAVQQWKVAPLILEAEVFEIAPLAEAGHEQATAAEADAPHEHAPEAWAPQDGAERIGYTVLANLLGAMGFAFLLAAVSMFSGLEITARSGVLWGLAGLIAFQLAPSLGLPPELPGMPAADLGARQVWWWATALSAGAGLLAIAKFRNPAAIAVAAVLLLLPHIVGAPHAPDEPSAVPAHLATAFASASLATGAVFWLTVGAALGWLNERFARIATQPVRVPA